MEGDVKVVGTRKGAEPLLGICYGMQAVRSEQ
jgi:GMP synthase-like glutamine amidotransferase